MSQTLTMSVSWTSRVPLIMTVPYSCVFSVVVFYVYVCVCTYIYMCIELTSSGSFLWPEKEYLKMNTRLEGPMASLFHVFLAPPEYEHMWSSEMGAWFTSIITCFLYFKIKNKNIDCLLYRHLYTYNYWWRGKKSSCLQ